MYEYLIAAGPLVCILSINLGIKAIPFVKKQIDILAKGCYDPLYDTLSLIYVHMSENPDQWKFDSNFARYPKAGNMAIITISKERDEKDLSISIADVNRGKDMKLGGYFNKVFREQIKNCFSFQSTLKVTTTLFPDKAHLLLTDSSKSEVNQHFYDEIQKSIQKVRA